MHGRREQRMGTAQVMCRVPGSEVAGELEYLGSWRRSPIRRWWRGWPAGPCSPRRPSEPCHPTLSRAEQRLWRTRDRQSREPRPGRWGRGWVVVRVGLAIGARCCLIAGGCLSLLGPPAFIGERRCIVLASRFGLARDPREILLHSIPPAFAKLRKLATRSGGTD